MTSALTILAIAMPGIIFDYAGATAPNGFLLCAGQAVPRSDYPQLFDVIGITYGPGDGSTTFNLPDLRGRVIAGRDNMGGTTAGRLTNAGSGIVGATLGAAGGTEAHALTSSQMPAHSHTISSRVADRGTAAGAGSSAPAEALGTSEAGNSLSMSSAGLGLAHPNAQPTIIMNKIIKT